MAINVNEVYKTVLLILNKEQRGYITPNEFNKTATQVQLEIFEKYFEDLNQNLRVRQDETEYADRVKNIDDRISIFKTQGTCTWNGTYNAFVLPTNVHRLGTVIYKDSIEIERVQKNDLLYVEPSTIQADVSVSYIRKPINPRFGYTVGSLGQYLYDSSDFIATGLPIIDNYLFSSLTTNFATSTSEPTKTVWNALTLASAGVTYVGNGSGLKFDLTLAVDGTITGITTNTPGTGFAIGDTITFSADTFQAGGTPGAVDAVITLNAASLYNGSTFGSTQFEIDNVDQTETILNILKYSGIVIRDPQIVQQASQLAAAEDQNEKS